MRKYFGTDGIRGVAGETLTADLSFKVGKALGKLLTDKKDRPKVIIGRDTRISCDMIEYCWCRCYDCRRYSYSSNCLSNKNNRN